MEGDLLSRMIFPKDCATSNFRIFLLLFSVFPWTERIQLWSFLGRSRIRNSSLFRKDWKSFLIPLTFDSQRASFEAMIEIMKRFNVEIYKTITVIRTKWNIINLNSVSFMFRFILSPTKDTYLMQDKEKIIINYIFHFFFSKKKHFKFNKTRFKILRIFVLL